jgi:hypothetical protein
MRMIESWLRSREQDIKMVSRTMLAGIALLFIGAGIEMVIRAQAPGFAVVAAGDPCRSRTSPRRVEVSDANRWTR